MARVASSSARAASCGGNSIVTAGHCVSDGTSKRPDKVTAFFYDGNSADPVVYVPGAPGVTTVEVGAIHVNPLYTGEVIDDHDIAVLKLLGAHRPRSRRPMASTPGPT